MFAMDGGPKIRILIVDDEAPARARLRQLLKPEADVEIVGECGNGRQALEQIQNDAPDLVFLDVQMPRLSGLELCEAAAAAGAQMPLLIFVTAYDEYALKAFEVHAIDYLLKPFDRERFQKALGHAREQLRRSNRGAADPRLEGLLEDLRKGIKKSDRLVFKQNGRVIKTFTTGYLSTPKTETGFITWNAPSKIKGTITHCVRGQDRAGNLSPISCASVALTG